MRHLFLASTFIFCSIISFSTDSAKWTNYASISGVEVNYQEVDCYSNDAPAQKAYLIQVKNTNNYRVSISWDLYVWYNNVKQEMNVATGENHYNLTIEANQELVGNCDQPYGALYIFKDFITYVSPTKLTKFELANITVAKQ